MLTRHGQPESAAGKAQPGPDAAHSKTSCKTRMAFPVDRRRYLKFGDCFAYALAEEYDCPLLYIGNEFAQTDIRSSL